MAYQRIHAHNSGPYTTSSNKPGSPANGIDVARARIKDFILKHGDQGYASQSKVDTKQTSRGINQQQYHQAESRNTPAKVEYKNKEERYRVERNIAIDEAIEFKDIVGKFEKQLNERETSLSEAREFASRIQRAKEDQELIFGPQAPDQFVVGKFEELRTGLTDWLKKYFMSEGRVDTSLIEKRFWRDLKIVAPNLTLDNKSKLLDEGWLRTRIITAWVWLYLTRAVFHSFSEENLDGSPARDLWLTRHQDYCFRGLEDALHEADRQLITHRDLNIWRALTASLLQKIGPGDEAKRGKDECVENICNEVIATVGIWARGPGLEQETDTATRDLVNDRIWAKYMDCVRGELKPLVIAAVDFSAFLRVQRAHWTVRFPKPIQTELASNLLIDPEAMENLPSVNDAMLTARISVGIIFSPALFKRGTLEGTEFNGLKCLVKSMVLCYTSDEVDEINVS